MSAAAKSVESYDIVGPEEAVDAAFVKLHNSYFRMGQPFGGTKDLEKQRGELCAFFRLRGVSAADARTLLQQFLDHKDFAPRPMSEAERRRISTPAAEEFYSALTQASPSFARKFEEVGAMGNAVVLAIAGRYGVGKRTGESK